MKLNLLLRRSETKLVTKFYNYSRDNMTLLRKFSATSITFNENPNDNEKSSNSTTSKPDVKFTNVNVRVIPKLTKRSTIDYSKSYTANIFISTVRAFNDYLLRPQDLETLPQYKRRNPFNEYGQEELITVYLRSDIEKKAIEIWGTLENLQKEKEKRRQEYEQRRKDLFNLKKSLKDYQNKVEMLESPLGEGYGTNASIMKTSSGKVVLSAIAINGLNFIIKGIGWIYTGSASLFSEAVHSLADTCNQLILAFGLHQSLKKPNPEHPYGFSNMTYITSLISGVGFFCFGTGLSWYHGITGILYPAQLESLNWGLALLLGSALSESGTLLMAYVDTRNNARKLGLGFWQYVIQGYKPSVNVVLLEDIAAVTGVFIAGSCMLLSHIFQNPIYDAIGSLAIGCLLGGVASFIIYTNTTALVGRSIPYRKIDLIRNDIESDIMIRSIHDIKATDLGGETVMFKAEVDIDGREITRSYLDRIDIQKLLEDIQQIQNTQDVELFLLKHGENIVDRVGAEIDRIERNLRKKYPDLQHVDLEVL